jgi:hypothetical protein
MADRIPMMPPKVFWDLIGASKSPSEDEFLQALHRRLVTLSPDEIVGFDARVWHYLGEANRDELWAAAFVLRGGCSDDNFLYFRCWLIAQGRQVFERALADPQSLADLPLSKWYNLEALTSSASEAWEEKTEEDFDAAKENAERTPYPDLIEADWDTHDENEWRARWPRLTAGRL